MSIGSPLNLSKALNYRHDVLVVGAGAAGLYAALCLPEHLTVGLITKDTLSFSASDWAQGGIAAAIDPNDSPHFHTIDTLKAGVGLCEPMAVEFLTTHASRCIHDLLRLGVMFDHQEDHLALTLEAAHSQRRVLHAADTTGRAVVSTLIKQVVARPNIEVIDQAFVVDLWLTASGDSCQGVLLSWKDHLHWLPAKAVILATGGGGQVFAQTTNPALSTGDGVAIASRAGIMLRDLEFIQFHPTALVRPGASHFLISEAVRGEGAHLIDHQGERFVFRYHPDGELAPRDVVSRAIYTHLRQTAGHPSHAHIWLDLRPIPANTIRQRFPNIAGVCQKFGIDVFTAPIPVAPAAHYWMGGILTDENNRTSMTNLYALGETASSGVHGANRLASNSLLECLVFGAQFAQLTLTDLPANTLDGHWCSPSAPMAPLSLSLRYSDTIEWINQQEQLRELMWQNAGICRHGTALTNAIAQIEQWQHDFNQAPLAGCFHSWLVQPPQGQPIVESPIPTSLLRTWGELRNLLEVAELILKSAYFRQESRGGHYRLDFPHPLEDWGRHTLVHGKVWEKSGLIGS